MATKLNMIARTALSETCKVATATAEVLRRLKRTSTFLGGSTFKETLTEYMDDLTGMGYPLDWRKEVVRAALRCYKKILK